MTVSGAEWSIVSEVERLRLGRSSGGNTAGLELVETAGQPLDKLWALSLSKRPSDDGCYENGKAWILEHGWIWQMPLICPEDLYSFRMRAWRIWGNCKHALIRSRRHLLHQGSQE
jgi:hypothetical protein